MAIKVHSANKHDSIWTIDTVNLMKAKFLRLKKILVGGGYRGKTLVTHIQKELGCKTQIALRPDKSSKKISVIPLRWIVERSFAWLENFRGIT